MPTILVVDDNANMTHLLEEFLQGLGYNVVCAIDGYSAMTMFQQHKPNLAILDYQMPAGLGTDVLAKIRGHQYGAHTPVIFLSVVSKSQIQKSVAESPRIRFMGKPVNLALLQRTISELLGPSALKPKPKDKNYDPDEQEPSGGAILDLDV